MLSRKQRYTILTYSNKHAVIFLDGSTTAQESDNENYHSNDDKCNGCIVWSIFDNFIIISNFAQHSRASPNKQNSENLKK